MKQTFVALSFRSVLIVDTIYIMKCSFFSLCLFAVLTALGVVSVRASYFCGKKSDLFAQKSDFSSQKSDFFPTSAAAPFLSGDLPSANDVPVVDYLVAFAPSGSEFARRRGGIAAFAQEIVDSINVVLRNSHVDGRFRLAGTIEISDEVPSINKGLGIVSSHPAVRAERDRVKADLVVLISEPFNDGASGLAVQEAQNVDAGFSSVRASMAAAAYTAAHEAAHNIGCQHSRRQVDAGNHPYAVGASRREFRTLMSGPYDDVGPQVPVFSGPESVWRGVTLGSETENNVRMLRERLPIVARFSEMESGAQLSQTEWVISPDRSVLDLEINTSTAYFVHTDVPWLHVSPENGYGARTFRVEADEFPVTGVGQVRTGHVWFELIDADEAVFPRLTVRQGWPSPTKIAPAVDGGLRWRREGEKMAVNAPAGSRVEVFSLDGTLLLRREATGQWWLMSVPTQEKALLVRLIRGGRISTAKIVRP